MQAVKATITDGNVKLQQPVDIKGPVDAIVVVLDSDPWQAIIDDPRPRPALVAAGQEALAEFLSGEAAALDLENSM